MEKYGLLFESIFKRKLTDENAVGYLENITKEHPYFSVAQFYLLQLLQKDVNGYKTQAKKTAVLFNNNHWLNFQLIESGYNNEVTETLASPAPTAAQHIADKIFTEEKPVEPALVETPIVAEPETIEQITTPIEEEKIAAVEEETRLVETANITAVENETPALEKFDEELIEAEPIAVTEEKNIAVENETAFVEIQEENTVADNETPAVEIIDEAVVESIQTTPIPALEEKIIADENKTPAVEANEEKIIEIETEAAPFSHAAEENTVANTESAATIAANEIVSEAENFPAAIALPQSEDAVAEPNEEPAAANEPFLFEPLHTTDYFASVGIKLSEEEKSSGKLGKQLMSFTEWLKTMKKVHTAQLADTTAPAEVEAAKAETNIQKLAEKSNQENDVVTEAMAEVLLQQGRQGKAIEILEKLSLLNPSKSAYFAAKINQIKEK